MATNKIEEVILRETQKEIWRTMDSIALMYSALGLLAVLVELIVRG